MFRKPIIALSSLIIAGAFLVGCTMPGGSGATPTATTSGACSNPLLPVVIGATWHYDVTGADTYSFARTIETTDSSGFTDKDIFPENNTTRSGKWKCDNGNLTRLDMNDTPSATVSRPSNLVPQMSFQTTDSSGVTLPAHITTGDSWTQTTSLDGTLVVNQKNVDATSDVTDTCNAAGNESVTGPAGTFNAVKLVCQIDQIITVAVGEGQPAPAHINYTTTYWYAENVGLVKSETSGNNIDNRVLLASYTVP